MLTPQELLENLGFRLKTYDPGRYYSVCPQCSAKRKPRHQRLPCVGITITLDKVFGGCNHCGWTFPGPGSVGGVSGRARWPFYNYGADLRKVRRPMGGFFWQHINGKGEWENGTAGADTSDLLYRLDEVCEAIHNGETVLVVDGEKDADTCWRLGFAATCNAHGASQAGKAPKWTAAHSEYLRASDLVVLHDNDDPGRAHAETVCRLSHGVARQVRRIFLEEEWPDIKDGEDISDWVSRGGGTAEKLEELIGEARHYDPAAPTQPASSGSPLPLANLALDGAEVPEPEWAVANRIPLRQVCLLSGHGAVGKSTIGLHLAVGHVTGRDWLKSIPALGPALFLDCEDDFAAIHYRLDAVRRFYDVSYQYLIDGGLEIMPMAGMECVLATVNPRTGVVTPTPLYQQILERAGDLKYVQVIIANAANVFAGNESDRSQVQQFIGLLKRITNVTGGSVVLISHSSLTGLSTETGLSGSTQWHNAVRARMWMHGVKANGADEQPDTDLRVLDFMKNQYGRVDDSVILRWKDGLYLPEIGLSGYELAAREAKAEEVFLALLRRFTANGRVLSDKSTSASNYAPKVMAKEREAIEAHLSKQDFEGAMRRLFEKKQIVMVTYGKPSAGWHRIEEVT